MGYGKKDRGRMPGRILLLLYMACVVYFLFFSEFCGRTDASQGFRYNLVLFKEISRFWTYRETLGFAAVFVNIIGNAAVFVPYGFALPVLFDRVRKFPWVPVLVLATSLAAETLQLLTRVGCFDVDDIFLNTLGGVLGYVIYLVVCRVRRNKVV